MRKRSISSAFFVLIVVGFLLLRQYVDYRLFNILTAFFMAVGTIELANALKKYLLKGWYYILIAFGIIFVPHFCFVSYYFYVGYGYLFSISLCALLLICATVQSLIYKYSLKQLGITLMPLVYPALLLLCWLLANEFVGEKGFISILLIFVISPLSDTMAYLVGMTYSKIKKGNAKKLCPKLSPNKTVAGAIGGVLGGLLGALLVYFIFTVSFAPLYLFMIVGVVASVVTILGDLFESLIKRRLGIKDMGKIMPGHGGIMDRIDGMSFAGAFIYLVFLFV